MKLAILALAVVGASAQTATQFQWPQQTQQQFFMPATTATAAAQQQFFFPTATAAPAAINNDAWLQQYYAQQQQQQYFFQPTQAPASRTEAPKTRETKTAADFSSSTLECVRQKDAFCRTGWDDACTRVAEERECTAAGTIATVEAILRCIHTKGKNGRTTPAGVSTNNGDEWCDRRLAQWDDNCDLAQAYCKEDVEKNTDEADRLAACVSARDGWCNKGVKWDDACTAVENMCKAPAPTEAPRAARVSISATAAPMFWNPVQNFQYPVQQFSNFQFQYPTNAGFQFPTTAGN